MKLSSSNQTTVILLLVLVGALLFAMYYYVISPKKEQVEQLESSIASIESEIASIEQEIDKINENKQLDSATLLEMRKKVPTKRDIQQLLLNIDETQYVSGTKIISVDFNNYDTEVSGSELSDPYGSSEEEGSEENGTDESSDDTTEEAAGETSDEMPVSRISKDVLPPELKLITFEIKIASPDFDHIVTFIKEVEKIERIMHIDLIDFSLPGEENEFAEDPEKEVEATIQVTTFYYEGES